MFKQAGFKIRSAKQNFNGVLHMAGNKWPVETVVLNKAFETYFSGGKYPRRGAWLVLTCFDPALPGVISIISKDPLAVMKNKSKRGRGFEISSN